MGVDKALSLGIYDVLLNHVEPRKRVVSHLHKEPDRSPVRLVFSCTH